MALSFKSVGHFFASAFQKVIVVEQKAAACITAVEKTETTVETVTTAVLPAAVPVEKAAYAVLGEIASLLTTAGEAGSAKLADAGLDVSVIQQVETLLKTVPTVVSMAKAL